MTNFTTTLPEISGSRRRQSLTFTILRRTEVRTCPRSNVSGNVGSIIGADRGNGAFPRLLALGLLPPLSSDARRASASEAPDFLRRGLGLGLGLGSGNVLLAVDRAGFVRVVGRRF